MFASTSSAVVPEADPDTASARDERSQRAAEPNLQIAEGIGNVRVVPAGAPVLLWGIPGNETMGAHYSRIDTAGRRIPAPSYRCDRCRQYPGR